MMIFMTWVSYESNSEVMMISIQNVSTACLEQKLPCRDGLKQFLFANQTQMRWIRISKIQANIRYQNPDVVFN